jgi:catechol 2,3-dioxygenase-like lactoylglutathione lyase family enzyme
MKTGWSSDRWRRHPLGIEGVSSIGIVVSDMAKAKRLYCDVLGGTLIHEERVTDRKESAFVAVGDDTVVELALPLSPASVEGRELATYGEGIYSLIFRTNDIERARDFLRSKHHREDADGTDTIVLGAEQAFGMRLGFTRRDLPNDPRSQSARLTTGNG